MLTSKKFPKKWHLYSNKIIIYSFDKKIKVFFIIDWMQFKLNV